MATSTPTSSVAGGSAGGAAPISANDAARFLLQASMGATRTQIARVQALGYSAWLDEQMTLPASTSRWDWLVGKGFNDISFKNSQARAFESMGSGPFLLC